MTTNFPGLGVTTPFRQSVATPYQPSGPGNQIKAMKPLEKQLIKDAKYIHFRGSNPPQGVRRDDCEIRSHFDSIIPCIPSEYGEFEHDQEYRVLLTVAMERAKSHWISVKDHPMDRIKPPFLWCNENDGNYGMRFPDSMGPYPNATHCSAYPARPQPTDPAEEAWEKYSKGNPIAGKGIFVDGFNAARNVKVSDGSGQ